MIVHVNGDRFDLTRYGDFHRVRIEKTLDLVRAVGGGRTVELGGHPWAMTARLLREPAIVLKATVSAEEVTAWPDEIPVTRRDYVLKADSGPEGHWVNYSANLERTLFPIDEKVDLVLACEIIEHLTRSPHVMLLNVNDWLEKGGRVVLTTPNGSQFENPFRVKAKMPAFRYNSYARHNFVFTLDTLVDLVECCGFEVERAEYWSPYRRQGGSNLYRALMKAPSKYLKDKFAQTIVVVARKVEQRRNASRLPKAYSPSPDWEHVDQTPGALA